MSVTYSIRFVIMPTERERFLALLDGVLDAMRDEPVFHRADLFEDPDDPNRLLLVETWEDHNDVLTVQLQRPYREAFHDALPEVLAAPRNIAIWRPRRSDHRVD